MSKYDEESAELCEALDALDRDCSRHSWRCGVTAPERAIFSGTAYEYIERFGKGM